MRHHLYKESLRRLMASHTHPKDHTIPGSQFGPTNLTGNCFLRLYKTEKVLSPFYII